jgi:hypothetical protein
MLLRVGDRIINVDNIASVDLRSFDAVCITYVFPDQMNTPSPYRERYTGDAAEALRRFFGNMVPDLLAK